MGRARLDDQTKADIRPYHPSGIARLDVITQAATIVQELSASVSAYDGKSVTEQLAIFGDSFDNLLSTATGEEYEAYRLDEVVVGAIAPIVSAPRHHVLRG